MRKQHIVIGIIVVLVIAGGVWWSKKSQNPTSSSTTLSNKARNLTADQEKIYRDRIAKAEQSIAAIPPNDSNARQIKSQAYVSIGQQYFGLGELEKSRQAYAKALELEPRHEQALVGLSLTLSDGGDVSGAEDALKRALDSNSESYDVWLRYIAMKQGSGASKEEIAGLYGQALEKTNRAIDVVTSAAAYQERAGNIPAAIELWKEAAQRYSDNPAYLAEVKRLESVNNQ
jgi:tetratricopeptide (TPR) repeat protein